MKTLTCVLLLALSAFGQHTSATNSPDCYFSATLTSASRTASFNNTVIKCNIWKVQIVNLSNNTAAYSFDVSSNGTTWTALTSGTITTVTAATPFNVVNAGNYFSVNLTSTGTGSVVVFASGHTYQQHKNTSNFGGPDGVAYTTLRDVASATVTYIGLAKSIFDPVTNTGYGITAIQKITYNGTPELTSVQWADGDSEEDNVWANRAALTYK